MRNAVFPFLCLFLLPFLTIAQDSCQGKQLPYQVSIAGKTDSITVAALLAAGKVQCIHKAFEITGFTVGIDGDCLTVGMYSEYRNESASFSSQAIRRISQMKPGDRVFLDCIRVKNQTGDVFLLKNQFFRICSK